MRSIIMVLITATFAFGEDAADIVRKAIQETEAPKDEPQIERVIKKANGDVETIYVIPGKGKAVITETKDTNGVPDDRKFAKETPPKETPSKETPKVSLDGLFVIVNDKKFDFKGHTPESANAALADQGGVPVFVTADNAVITPPPWYKGPTSTVKKVTAALPPPPKMVPAVQAPTRAPQVAQGFPTTRPTPVQSVGQSNGSLLVTTQMAPTITSATVVGPGGSTKGCKT